MDVQATKIELIKLVLDLEDEALIEKIGALLRKESGDFWDSLTEDQRSEIKLGLRLLDDGRRTSAEDFLKRIS